MGADMEMAEFAPGFIASKWAPHLLGGWYSPPPEKVSWAGDLVVVDTVVRWTSPERENEGAGAFVHRVPDGTYPVYVNAGVPEGEGEPGRYRVDTLFIPLAGPERLRTTRWSSGYDDVGQLLGDYACLRSQGASRGEQSAILRAKQTLLSEESRTRTDNWTNEVVDPETGANILSFPVAPYGEVHGFEALSEDNEILALLFLTNHD
ncbi:hypothetical protein E1281_02530 [Actinomadura sp. KC345]|uniref:hypothetical protein n=1 Tax=Actinomadura sp. KC345 TaxID=2530371 RepID=UPI0010450FD8|nr:hypothetical protein [Actinomadura sp. KC345]TDC58077.1 hypothetical protein E1281_02530 [Actinomadura sp. KC345]